MNKRSQTAISEKSLEERLRFETLLSEISDALHQPARRPDRQRASKTPSAASASCWILTAPPFGKPLRESPGAMHLTHWHLPSGSPSPPEGMDASQFFPWMTQKVRDGETVIISKLTDFPPEASRDLESFRAYDTKSTVLVPLSVGEGPVFGVLGFAVMREERRWTETEVTEFRLIAQVFANALARKQAEQTLRDSEARLSVAISAAGAGLWIMDTDSGNVWVSPKIRELFHFPVEEKLKYESWFKVMHPEDRERVHQAVQQALQSGKELQCDYRICLPDGSIRWIVARGLRHLGSAGEPPRLMGASLDITERKLMEEKLKARLSEIEELKQRLEKRTSICRRKSNSWSSIRTSWDKALP